MKSRAERKAEFAAKKAQIMGEVKADLKANNEKLAEGRKRASEQRKESNEKSQAKYAERVETYREELDDAKETFQKRRAARKTGRKA